MNDEDRLREKLRAIEALFAGATTPGERVAADQARQRIRTRIEDMQAEEVVEWQFSLDPWTQRLFVALARRYGLSPYRYKGQRYSTLMVRAPKRFIRETFQPEFQQMADTFHEHLSAVTDRVVAQVLHDDATDAPVVDQPRVLPSGRAEG